MAFLEGLCAYLASLLVIFPPLLHLQTVSYKTLTSFGPTDNQFQLRAEVSSAELWKPVHGGHGPLKGLYGGYRGDT